MQTFSQALIELVLAGEVERETAASAASNRHDFLLALDQAVRRRESGVDDVLAAQAQKRPEPDEPEAALRVVEW
jgi:Tfp pilus assembly ATPase PilU